MYKVVNFEYGDGWMIVLYENDDNTEYWCCDEHDWEDAWKYINLLEKNNDVEIINLEFNNYSDVCKFNKENNIDIFSLAEIDFNKLRTLQ